MANRKKSPNKRPKKAAPRTAPPKAAAAKPDSKIERFRQNMRCELAEDEILERSRRISRQLSEKALRVEAAKSATAHLKAEIKQIDSEVSRLSQEINDGACFREVDCERRYLYRVGKIIEVRIDSGAVTFERAMSGAERQPTLPGLDGEDDAPDSTPSSSRDNDDNEDADGSVPA